MGGRCVWNCFLCTRSSHHYTEKNPAVCHITVYSFVSTKYETVWDCSFYCVTVAFTVPI